MSMLVASEISWSRDLNFTENKTKLLVFWIKFRIRYTISEMIGRVLSFSPLPHKNVACPASSSSRRCHWCWPWPKNCFVYLKVSPSNDRIFCIYAPSGNSTKKQLNRERLFEELQNCVKNKNEGNENKTILGDFNCTVDKRDKDGWDQPQRLFNCSSNNSLSRLIVYNGLEHPWRRNLTTTIYHQAHDSG